MEYLKTLLFTGFVSGYISVLKIFTLFDNSVGIIFSYFAVFHKIVFISSTTVLQLRTIMISDKLWESLKGGIHTCYEQKQRGTQESGSCGNRQTP